MISIALMGISGSIARVYREVFKSIDPAFAQVVAGIDPAEPLEDWGVPVFPTLEAFMESGMHADAIEVLTPPGTHVKLVQDCLAAGYHVLVEKPPAFSPHDCQKMIASAGEKTLFFGYHAQYAHGVPELKELLKTERVTSFSIIYLENVLDYRLEGTTDLHPGALWDSAINALSVLTEVLPEMLPCFVRPLHIWVDPEKKVVSRTFAEFEWSHGSGTFFQDWLLPKHTVRVLEFQTHSALYRLDIGNRTLTRNDEVLVEGPPGTYDNEYYRQQLHFLNCINRGESYTPIKPVELVEALQKP